VSNRDVGAGEIYTIRPRRRRRRPGSLGGNADPALLPDGSKIAFKKDNYLRDERQRMKPDGTGA